MTTLGDGGGRLGHTEFMPMWSDAQNKLEVSRLHNKPLAYD